MSTHARLSPSSAHRWMRCGASLYMESQQPNNTNVYSAEGTAAHFLAALCLEKNQDAELYSGRLIAVLDNGESIFNDYPHIAKRQAPFEFAVSADMVRHVQTYITAVREYATGGDLLVEQRVDFSQVVGVENQFGTADAIIVSDNATELQVHDLKYGMGVQIDAENNEQLMLYALGALNDYGFLGDFQRVRTVIHQPRLDHISEWSYSIDQLEAFAAEAKAAAGMAISLMEGLECGDGGAIADLDGMYSPGDKQCRFCKAKAHCPALTKQIFSTILDDFGDCSDLSNLPERMEKALNLLELADNERLSMLLQSADLIEQFIKAVRAAVETELFAGREVPGYKLVQGKKGARKWTDDAEAEAALKAMRLKVEQMFDMKLISPTSAERLNKAGTIGPRQWPKLQDLITQSEGKPSVAPESDKRPALIITATIDDFADLDA